MALFGSRRLPLEIVPFADEQPAYGSAKTPAAFSGPSAQRARRGLFGNRARGIVRREDGDPGTFLNYALFGRNGVEGMREGRMRRDLFGMQMGEAKREDEQRQQLETLIAQLPPDQQLLARANPQAFVEALMRSRIEGGWEHGQGYSHLWRPNPDGTVTLGDPLPLRPRQQTGYSSPEDNEEWEAF